ncbi:MAG: ATP-binding cassette domain-containing protein [Eubacterium sp.]|nr:ATP-binding cassette domain-containing protein [Eubacterium sp.]
MIVLEHVGKTFSGKGKNIEAVKDVNLHINAGEIFGIIGFSGAGKSTLVRCINMLETPTEGRVIVDGVDLTSASAKELKVQRRNIGMIFQQFNLLAQKNVLSNICFPLEIAGVNKQEALKRANELLDLVGLSDKGKSYPAELSGGQKQRVAIARALATNPKVLLADEATSALDPITTRSILSLLKEINERLGVTIVVITHQMSVVEQICDRVAIMSGGVIEEEGAVRDVFTSPKSETGKKIVLPEQSEVKEPTISYIRIVFDGQASSKPVLADIVMKTGIPLSIMGAATQDIGGSAYGQLLVEKPKDEKSLNIIKEYLEENGLSYSIKEVH